MAASKTHWQKLWADALAAQDAGRISKAAALFVEVGEIRPPHGQPLYDAGCFILVLNRNLEGLERLNTGHRSRFGLAEEEFPSAVPNVPIGPKGWELAQRYLLEASLGVPDRAGWQTSLAEALERGGQLRQALYWRRNIARLQPDWRDNRIALGLLLATLGAPEAAARHYESMLERWPWDAEVMLRLAGQYVLSGGPERGGEIFAELRDAIECEGGHSSRWRVGVVLSVAFAAARVGVSGWPAGLARTLAERSAAAAAALPGDARALLAEGYALLAAGETARARSCFAGASLAAERTPPLPAGDPLQDQMFNDALPSARAFLLDSAGSLSSAAPALPADPSKLARAHARAAWVHGERIASLNTYLAAVRPYLVDAIPVRYEMRGHYKLLFHAADGRFYAVPRDVPEFAIINGRVYVVTGMARLSLRRLPPWAFAIALRMRSYARMLVRALPVLRPVALMCRRAAAAFVRSRALQRPLRAIGALGWRRYRVRGVLVAETLETLLTLIESMPSAAGGKPSAEDAGASCKPVAAAEAGVAMEQSQ